MSLLDDPETIHENVILDLTYKFTNYSSEYIRQLYNQKRNELEEQALIKDFIHVLITKQIKEELNG